MWPPDRAASGAAARSAPQSRSLLEWPAGDQRPTVNGQHRVLILECAGIHASGLHGRAGVIEAGLCPVPIALRHVVLPLANRVQIAVIALELLAKLFVQIADVAAERLRRVVDAGHALEVASDGVEHAAGQ